MALRKNGTKARGSSRILCAALAALRFDREAKRTAHHDMSKPSEACWSTTLVLVQLLFAAGTEDRALSSDDANRERMGQSRLYNHDWAPQNRPSTAVVPTMAARAHAPRAHSHIWREPPRHVNGASSY
ncbi:hypothetical protein MAPG_00005 [Magnaporthiopsis poae ATCC 64411]|uniref:Uncharacterized protein n=1 Tax=Magnaporthiopsis poae (strain ATCC 64411 / 73-15) TaxID=644358 RepID=A0A0C4DJU7_MAGP6|nr:hypothetical protein MAPG_00005 [Magnaporthiopsis poae ATCC 64411]